MKTDYSNGDTATTKNCSKVGKKRNVLPLSFIYPSSSFIHSYHNNNNKMKQN